MNPSTQALNTKHLAPLKGRVLIVAGSDSGGGAGIQGDIKTVTRLGGYAATALTALTAQNTLGVASIYPVHAPFVSVQMRVVLEDIGADCIKTGMLASAGVIEAVADTLKKFPPIPLVLDPVMIAKGGAALLEDNAVDALRSKLLPLATIITPNIPEAERLAGITIRNAAGMEKAARKIAGKHAVAVLIKGGHLESDIIMDLLWQDGRTQAFTSPRIDTPHTHGTGCTLASAIATGIAQNMNLEDAVTRARDYVHAAILNAPGLGKGHGPLGH